MDNNEYILIKNKLQNYTDNKCAEVLPAVTASDNGKVMVVANGEWAPGTEVTGTISVSGTKLVIQGV